MLVLMKSSNLLKTLKVAKLYEDAYLKGTRLPYTTPLIINVQNKEKHDEKLSSLSFILKSCFKVIVFCGIVVNVGIQLIQHITILITN